MSNSQYDNNTSQPKKNLIDLSAVFNKYKRYWWLFLLSLIGCLALAIMYLRVKLPEYEVLSTILVAQDDDAGSAGASLLKSLSIGGGGSKVDDEIVVLGSQDITYKMVKELKLNRRYTLKKDFLKKEELYKNSPIEVEAPEELFDTLSIGMNFKIAIGADGKADIKVKKGWFKTIFEQKGLSLPATVRTRYGSYVVRPTQYFMQGKPMTINANVKGNLLCTEDIMEDLDVSLVSKKSNAIAMSYPSTDIERGKDMLNTMIRFYNERGQQEKDEQAINTAKFIEDRLGLIYKDLTGSEAEIEAYKKAHNMADVGIQTKASIGRQEAAESKIVALEAQYRIVSMINEFISDPRNRHSYIPFEADSTAASGSIRAFNELAMRRADLAKSAKEGNEALQEIDSQLDAMRETIRKGVNNTLNALRVQIDKAGEVSNTSQSEMSQVPTQEREIRSLYREQGIQNTLYTFLLQKREENALVLAATTPKGKIVDHAYTHSKPIRPKKPIVYALALLAAILLPISLLYTRALFLTKFSTQDELADIATAPVLGEICHNRHKSQLVVKPGKTSSIVELFRLLRNNVQFLMTRKDDKVLLVTSSVSGEGKSFVSTNLAASFALLGKKVALVGMDIRNPQLANMLSLTATPGVTSYLSTPDMRLNEIVQRIPEAPDLDILVAGAIPPNPSELLLGERTSQFFDELRHAYDIIVIDSAPVAMVSDTFSLAQYGDATLYVTRANYTKRSHIKYLNQIVANKQLKRVSLIINDSNPKLSTGYGYGYGSKDD